MFYRKDIDEVIEHHKAFHSATSNGHILIQVDVFEENRPWPDMRRYNLPVQWRPYVDEWIVFWERQFKRGEEIADDKIPVVDVHFGVGPLSAFVGGEISFGAGTSWGTPVIKNWEDLDNLKLSEDNHWFKLSNEVIKYLSERADGKFRVPTLVFYNPSDLANALRGNTLFTDLYDWPREVHRLMDFCTDAVIWFAEAQKKIVGLFREGTLITCGGGLWLPGRTIPMSADAADLCSPGIYNEFFKKYDQKVIDHFGGGWIHTHSLGLHVVAELTSLKNLHVLQIAEDPKQPRPVEVLSDLIEKAHGVSLQINCTAKELKDIIDAALGGNVIFNVTAQDIQEAQEVVNLARKCSK